jgi:hypothetical protein
LDEYRANDSLRLYQFALVSALHYQLHQLLPDIRYELGAPLQTVIGFGHKFPREPIRPLIRLLNGLFEHLYLA